MNPDVEHPLAVAALLSELRLDTETLAAALLHDTVEDSDVTVVEISREFNPHIAKLVEGVTKLGKIHVHTREQAQAENIRKMLVAMAEDIRVVLIKLADRLHNMRTVGAHTEERRQRISRETLDIYAPLAHRLGIWQFKAELEDLAFAQLDPDRYRTVEAKLRSRREQRAVLSATSARSWSGSWRPSASAPRSKAAPRTSTASTTRCGASRRTSTRSTTSWRCACLVDSVKDCYTALGVVHHLWKPIPGRFKDYIAMPKGNGYQSLHTTMISHTGEPVEVQIRTVEMHHTAEYGVAAHWHYKAGGAQQVRFDERYGWLRLLMDWQKELTDAETFVNSVKVDIFQDEVFVFTPKGDVRSLPAGSTTVDFAYRVHTDVGHHCIGAKVSGRMVPLDYRLQNGDIVEILTTKAPHGPCATG